MEDRIPHKMALTPQDLVSLRLLADMLTAGPRLEKEAYRGFGSMLHRILDRAEPMHLVSNC